MSRKILVTGTGGQLGNELRVRQEQSGDIFVFADRDAFDMADVSAIEAYFEKNRFDVIVNCAAYTAVDRAESDETAADAVNHLAVKALAGIAKKQGISLVHISTDYVFDGKSFRPYVEEDVTDPQGIYGKTKRDGEKAMLEINPANSIIIRTSWVYSAYGANFVKTMLRLGAEREELGVIFDQVGTPTYAGDLAEAILRIIPQLSSEGVDICHYSNEGVCSWYDFAKAIFELSNIQCRVNAIETKAYPTPASRPHYSLLNKSKIKSKYMIEIPYWRDSLKACLKIISNKEKE